MFGGIRRFRDQPIVQEIPDQPDLEIEFKTDTQSGSEGQRQFHVNMMNINMDSSITMGKSPPCSYLKLARSDCDPSHSLNSASSNKYTM